MSEYSGVIGRLRHAVNREYGSIRFGSDKFTQDKNHDIRDALYYHFDITDMIRSHSAALEQLCQESDDE